VILGPERKGYKRGYIQKKNGHGKKFETEKR
jgi:hypothetical protein